MSGDFLHWHFRSLKTRVTIFAVAIFVISIWVLAFSVSRMLREDIQRLLSDQQFSTASCIAMEINEELAQAQDAVCAKRILVGNLHL